MWTTLKGAKKWCPPLSSSHFHSGGDCKSVARATKKRYIQNVATRGQFKDEM
jgi:hypothetical protein